MGMICEFCEDTHEVADEKCPACNGGKIKDHELIDRRFMEMTRGAQVAFNKQFAKVFDPNFREDQ